MDAITNTAPINIPLNKKKLTLMFVGALAFAAIGIKFILNPDAYARYGTLKITLVGYSALILFGVAAVFILVKLFNKKPGLIIDEKGITDNASAISAGLIPWEDINSFTITQIYNQRLIMINVSNPDEYVSRQTNAIKRKIAQANYNSYGSPISLSTNGIKYDFDELYKLLNSRSNQFKSNGINQ